MVQSRKKITVAAKEALPAAFFTVKELATYLKISARMVRKLIDKRELGFVQIGSRVLIPTTAVRQFLEEHYVAPIDAKAIAIGILAGRIEF